ncbi:MAG: oxidoreductase [Actinomycetota bacterium]|nr:oxidoreductase [Actinomycetota bacterium]MDG1489915.1 oxidoreductase [Actinomycetota bacterium]MDG2121713.1 oxidoreductase [Actinomycetota bacterium]
MSFRAVMLSEKDRQIANSIVDLEDADLPQGDVLVSVDYSTLNYKDGMVLSGIGRLVRNYPHIPGIDFSGVVEASHDPRFKSGDRVVLTGWKVGELHWGGFAEKARVNADWLVKLPESLSNLDAMAVGTAGLTSMLAMQALEEHGIKQGPVLVTGAAGGVGSVAIHLLASAGYDVAASTGRPETEAYLRSLGATSIIQRSELAEEPTGPLASERWGGCIDAVGDVTLAHVLTEMQYGSSIAACGLAGGNALNTTVIPFLLRAVNLLGIDSVVAPFDSRVRAWARLDELLDRATLESMTTIVSLLDASMMGPQIIQGQVQGRVVVDVKA